MAFPLSAVRRPPDSMGSYGGSIAACFWKNSLSRDHPGWKRSLPETEEFRESLSRQASPYREGIHSLPEAEELRDPCMILRGGSAGSLMADMTGREKPQSLPEAEGPRDQCAISLGEIGACWEVSLVARS